MLYSLFRRLLFSLEPETAHYLTMDLLQLGARIPGLAALWKVQANHGKPVEMAGLQFPNRVGLAAGFDKNGQWIPELASLGFGHIEIGTVTPKPQPGNPSPRLFRIKQDEALLNRLGFNNQGVSAMAGKLKHLKMPEGLIIGGNLGKNKDRPNEEAELDYAESFRALAPYVDYFTLNVSSPNTPGLRELQDKAPLERLLRHLQKENEQLEKPKPLFLKIAPDLTTTQLDEVLDLAFSCKLAAIVATNTTLSRKGLSLSNAQIEALGPGGISGKPLREKSLEVLTHLAKYSEGKIPLVAVGGISTLAHAQAAIDQGATLVQLYTGFVYQGPKLIKALAQL